MRSKRLRGVALMIVAAAGAAAMAAEKRDYGQLLATASQRIEKHRQAEATVTVVDAAGKPVPGAAVAVEQTRHAFLFGSNIYSWGKIPDEKLEAAYRARFAALLNYATLPFYWSAYEPRRGEPNHAYTEKLARWCREQGIATKGHPLAWNHADPAWLPADVQEIRRLQMARIDDCVARFAGLIDRWDVVNEATHFERPEFAQQKAPKFSAMWKQLGRMEFTRECFAHARNANPQATLLINDYRTDPPYEKVIEQLVDDGGKRMYDVIGIQSHMHSGAWPNAKIWEVCERFARFGVPLHFTEMTIISGEKRPWGAPETNWQTTPEGEAAQAREVARFYTMLFSHPAVEAITWWDFSDFHAWRHAPAGFLRADMTPKPAYDELMKLIKGRWWTKTSLQTGADGTATFRGFLGDYKVTVIVGDKQAALEKVALRKEGASRWQVKLTEK